MKITPEIKQSPTFIFAKMKGLNNREAARFFTILSEGINEKKCDEKALEVYVNFCREPKVIVTQFAHTLPTAEGNVKPTRSKLVMEYEKHRKMFIKLVQIRTLNQILVDAIISKNFDTIKRDGFTRYSVLVNIGKEISPNA